jgi:hypothetical protein
MRHPVIILALVVALAGADVASARTRSRSINPFKIRPTVRPSLRDSVLNFKSRGFAKPTTPVATDTSPIITETQLTAEMSSEDAPIMLQALSSRPTYRPPTRSPFRPPPRPPF